MTIDVAAIHAASPTPLELARTLNLQPSKRSSSERALVLCPWHSEKNPSCTITRRDGKLVAHCKSCNQGGDLLSIVAAVEGLDTRRDFRRVCELSAKAVGIAVPRTNDPNRAIRRRDPSIDLAMRIESDAARYLRGGPWPVGAVDQCTEEQFARAMQIIRIKWGQDAADALVIDDALDAVGTELEAAGRLDWTEIS